MHFLNAVVFQFGNNPSIFRQQCDIEGCKFIRLVSMSFSFNVTVQIFWKCLVEPGF
ncbi:hypothetical protein D3C75_644710 [compost metagenome]